MLFYFTLSFNSYPNGPVVWAISFDSTCPVLGSCLSSPVTLAAVQCSVAAGGKEGVVVVPGCPWAVPQVQLWQGGCCGFAAPLHKSTSGSSGGAGA